MTKASIRLQELKGELEKGRKQLELYDHQRRETLDMLLRISGAIQVLEELLNDENAREQELDRSVNGATPVSAHVG